MSTEPRRALFVTWDGAAQSYLESLFFPIFAGMTGWRFSVLQFTTDPSASEGAAAAARRHGMGYRAVPSWRVRGGAAGVLASVARGALELRHQLGRRPHAVVLTRSILPAAMALLAREPRLAARWVFDADGLPADERVEFAGWHPGGAQYRAWRAIEVAAVRRADSVIVRTARAERVLAARAGAGLDAAKLHVVPNAKDAQLFSPGTPRERSATRRQYGVSDAAPWLVFVGGIGPQYHPEQMLWLFQELLALRPDARLHLFTQQPALLRPYLERVALPAGALEVGSLTPAEVPRVLAAADVGLALRTPSFSQGAVSPIKVAEYLLCGLPVVSTAGVGDLDRQLGEGTGHVLSGLDREQLAAAAAALVREVLADRPAARERCRAVGLRHFALEQAIAGYRAAFEGAAAPDASGEPY